jgi:hypothetical protein
MEYLLRRAAYSGTKSEQVAWWSVWAVVVFVEHEHRFPRKGELYPYLHNVLDESKTLEGLKLPKLEFLPGTGPGEAQRTSTESLQHEVSVLRQKLQSVHKLVESQISIWNTAVKAGGGISPTNLHLVYPSLLEKLETLSV